MSKNKLLKTVVAAAAIGSVCYVFRDKIKASTAYQKLDEKIDVDDKVSKVNEKVAKVKDSIMEKMPVKDGPTGIISHWTTMLPSLILRI